MKSLTSLSTKKNECFSNYGQAMALGHFTLKCLKSI